MTLKSISKDTIRVAVYIRVSTDRQVEDGHGLESQLHVVRNYINSRDNLELAWEQYIYQEEWVSWVDDIHLRPELSRLIDDIKFSSESPFDTVIVYKIDRFARKLSVLLNIIDELRWHWVGFISTQEMIDTNTVFGNAMLGILWVFAELEKNMIQERTALWRERSLNKWTWIRDVYWFRRDTDKRPVVHQREEGVIKEIFDMFVNAKMSVWQIARELTERKELIPDVSMKWERSKAKNIYNWWDKTLRKILANHIYIWIYYYDKSKSEKDSQTWKRIVTELDISDRTKSEITHRAIIDEAVFAKAQERLSLTQRQSKTDTPYLLSRLVKCDACASQRARGMLAWIWKNTNAKKWKRYYQCLSKKSKYKWWEKCKVLPIAEEDLDRLVLHRIRGILNRPQTIKRYYNNALSRKSKAQYTQEKLDKLKDLRQQELDKLDRAKTLFIEWEYTKASYNQLKYIVEKRFNEINISIVQTQKALKNEVNIASYVYGIERIKLFLDMSIDELLEDKDKANRLLRYLIDEIVIFARPLKKTDKALWRRVSWQQVCHRIWIKLKLPQQILANLWHFLFEEDGTISWDTMRAIFERDDDEMIRNLIYFVLQHTYRMSPWDAYLKASQPFQHFISEYWADIESRISEYTNNWKKKIPWSDEDVEMIFLKSLKNKLLIHKIRMSGWTVTKVEGDDKEKDWWSSAWWWGSVDATQLQDASTENASPDAKKIVWELLEVWEETIKKIIQQVYNSMVRYSLFYMGRTTGLEPATTGTTNQGSTNWATFAMN